MATSTQPCPLETVLGRINNKAIRTFLTPAVSAKRSRRLYIATLACIKSRTGGRQLADEDEAQLGPTMRTLVDLAKEGGEGRVHEAVKSLNAIFFEQTDGGHDPFRRWGLARQLDCYLVAVDSTERIGVARRAMRPWQTLISEMEGIRDLINGAFPFATGITPSDLSGLARYSTAHCRKPFFYSSVTLFLINAFELDGEMAAFTRALLPTSEQDMLAGIKERWFKPVVEGGELLAPDEVEDADPVIETAVPYKEAELEAFERFFRKFARDESAHFVCYRNGSNQPGRVVKTFLTIEAPHGHPGVYHFSHFYEVPRFGAQSRVSRGIVLPLERGVYLIGGHRLRDENDPTTAASSLEIIVLDWGDLSVPEPLLRTLTLTCNYQGEPIAARMFLRATPISQCEELGGNLDSIDVAQLLDDLETDLSREVALGTAQFSKVPAADILIRILDHTNNVGARWDASFPFHPVEDDDEVRILDEAAIKRAMNDAFGTEDAPRFVADSAENITFDFWRDVRFSPLSQH